MPDARLPRSFVSTTLRVTVSPQSTLWVTNVLSALQSVRGWLSSESCAQTCQWYSVPGVRPKIVLTASSETAWPLFGSSSIVRCGVSLP